MAKKNKATVKYPRRAQFTIQDVIDKNTHLNQQTVRNHVRLAINDDTLAVVSTRRGEGRGRPRFVLARN